MSDQQVLDTARHLLTLTHDQFKAEVDQDIRPPRDPALRDARWEARHAALRSPSVVDRWFTVLSMIAKSVDGQLAATTEDYEANKAATRSRLLNAKATEEKAIRVELETLKSRYSKTRAKTLRFKTGLDEALIEARALRDGIRDRVYDSVVAEERNRYAARVTMLETAIREHRDACDAADIDPEVHDEHLWAVIDR